MSLPAIYKSFIRPHLDYGDVIYDQAYTVSFQQKIEFVQDTTELASTGAIRGTSKEKHYHELGLETVEKRKWYRKLYCFYKISRHQSPKYLFNIIPTSIRPYSTRNANNFSQFKVKHNFFQKFVFLFCSYWMEQAGPKYTQLRVFVENLLIFKKKLLKFIPPSGNSVFRCHKPKGIKLLTRLRFGLSHLREHKFKHFFSRLT